ncbi:MAG: arylsulfatase [Flavobacteriaceae bacterium]
MAYILKHRFPILLMAFLFMVFACKEDKKEGKDEKQHPKPNVVLIYADDLGFGDLSSYGATELPTPNIDRIANEGIRFTNGYATSATCTPSRYALLAGEYPWRKKAAILRGNAPLIFDVSKPTMATMFQRAGYKTAVIGKWHLGLGEGGEQMDWNLPISPSPNDVGFDYSFILASTNDRVPSVYVENDKVVGLDPQDPIQVSYKENFEGEPTGSENPEMLKLHPSHGHDMSVHNGISRIGYMKGGKSALWIDEDMADTVLVRSQKFITENKDKPFFLFYSLHQPHVPRTPHSRFVGTSGMGPRGDAILEADWCVGQLLDTLDSLGLTENTIVVFSSDNGPVLDDGYQDDANEKLGDHTPAGRLRGGKYSLFDAGAHVPFMIRWPGTIAPQQSNALVSQMDLYGSFAKLVGQENSSGDSKDLSGAFLGKSPKGRESLVLEATGRLCFRKGDWVLIPPHQGRPKTNKWVNIETGNSDEYQLYNLLEDPSQEHNLATENPGKVQEMEKELMALKK